MHLDGLDIMEWCITVTITIAINKQYNKSNMHGTKSDCKGELKVTTKIMYACMHKIGWNGFPAEDKMKSTA